MEVLTVVQATEFLQVHQDTLYRLLDKEEIPAAKIRGTWRFIKSDLVTYNKRDHSPFFVAVL